MHGMFVSAVTVQRRPDAQEKLERVAEIVAIVAIERIGAVVDGELGAETYVDAIPCDRSRAPASVYPLTGKISDSSASSRTSSWPDFCTRSQRK